MPHHSALRCVSGIRQNKAKPLISNGLRFIVTYLLTGALWVLFHQSRHTFGTLLMSAGIPIESISKMMGHTNIRTTQTYARVTDDKISEDMDRLMQVRKANGLTKTNKEE